VFALLAVVGCGDTTSNTSDMPTPDMSVTTHDMAMSGGSDMTMVVPFNMPGQVDCYNSPTCATASATPVCCDSKTDGGFTDNCVASAQACLATDPQAKTFACGQAADCGGGMICCGTIGTSGSGKQFFTSTQCAASCAAGDTQLCVADAECKAASTHCNGITISGRDVGLCK
jgi:hypothetical protein